MTTNIHKRGGEASMSRTICARVTRGGLKSPTFTGTWVYTKGTLRRKGGREVFYVFVSAKLAV